MAIVFDCPHCKHQYRLKDEFAGRKATCKNPDCRQQITIPIPPSAAELEAAATSALSDETPGLPAAGTPAPAEQSIPVSCSYCGHNWTEPLSKAGKNTLCPNPECRQRIRVPEPKTDQVEDWRQQKTKLPSLAKQAHEKLEGVEDATSAKTVSGEALREAGATGVEIEPRSLKEKAIIVFGILIVVVGIGLGIRYLVSSRTENIGDGYVKEALEEYGKTEGELAKTEAGLCKAVLESAAAEYALRKNDEKKLAEAHDLITKAVNAVRTSSEKSPVKHVVAGEMASLIIAFGGTEDEVKAQTRYPWRPGVHTGRLGSGQRPKTVHEELIKALGILREADYDNKISLARRLTHELVAKKQAELAAEVLPLALFTDAQRDEARAVIALEIRRKDPGSDIPQKVAESLKSRIESELKAKKPFTWYPSPASALTLCTALNVEIRMQLAPPGGGNTGVTDSVRLAYTGKHLMHGEIAEALALAKRGASTDGPSQLRSLVLCAEWMEKPAEALDAAVVVVNSAKGKQSLSQPYILRLSQIGFATGNHQQAKDLANSLVDEGMKAWAFGDRARIRALANPKEKADEGWFEAPNLPDKLKVGHAWGRYWMARLNTRISNEPSAEKKVVEGWSPSPLRSFGLMGIALGWQDR